MSFLNGNMWLETQRWGLLFSVRKKKSFTFSIKHQVCLAYVKPFCMFAAPTLLHCIYFMIPTTLFFEVGFKALTQINQEVVMSAVKVTRELDPPVGSF